MGGDDDEKRTEVARGKRSKPGSEVGGDDDRWQTKDAFGASKLRGHAPGAGGAAAQITGAGKIELRTLPC
jgi:hypothetical protein